MNYNQLITELQVVKDDISTLRQTRENKLAQLYRCEDNQVAYYHKQLRQIDNLLRIAKKDRKDIIAQLEMTLDVFTDVNGTI